MYRAGGHLAVFSLIVALWKLNFIKKFPYISIVHGLNYTDVCELFLNLSFYRT